MKNPFLPALTASGLLPLKSQAALVAECTHDERAPLYAVLPLVNQRP